MFIFSWKDCFKTLNELIRLERRRKPRRTRTARIEVLEDRALLTANLPIAVDDIYSVAQSSSLNGTSVLLNDTDADGDTVNQAILQNNVTHGTLTLLSDGSFTYVPDTGYAGSDSFTYFAFDSAHGESSASPGLVTFHVGTMNGAPIANATTISTAVNTVITGTLTGTDPNGDPLTFAAGATSATNGSVTISPNGTFTFTPAPDFTGVGTFSFKVNDGTVDSSDATVTVQIGSAGNSAPVTSAVTIATATNTMYSGVLTAFDANGDVLSFAAGSVQPAHGSVSINPNGSFTYTPATGYTGTDAFSFKASDGSLTSPDTTVTVNVGTEINVAPVGTPGTVSVQLDTAFSGTLAATDANGDSLTYAAGTTTAGHGTVTISPNGNFTYTPSAGFTGIDSFSFTASDGVLISANTLETVHVGIANSLPVATPVTLSTPTNTALSGTLSASDANGDPLTFSAGSTVATHGSVVINPNGTFTFTPTSGFTGSATFSFKANDGIGSSGDATVTINVGTGTNTAPVGISATVSTATGVAFNGTLSATDADGDPLTFSAGPTGASHGSVTINPNGTFTYTPNTGFTGTDTFSFVASDGTLTSAIATETVQVGIANSLPTVGAVAFSTPISTALTGTLTGTDANGDPLTFSIGSTAATHGTVVINPNGTFIFIPISGYSGVATFSYKANDGTGDSADATATVNVGGTTNTAPVVINGSGTMAFGANLEGSVSPLATDGQGNPLTFAAVTTPAHGTLLLSPDGTFTYTPDSGFTGTDSFTFKANDGLLDSNVGTFNITVSAASNSITLNLRDTGTIATKRKEVVPLDSNANLTTTGSGISFANASITASIANGGDSQRDQLLVTKVRNSNVQVRAKKVLIDGRQVATLAGGKHGQQLEVTFNSNATQADVLSVVRRIGAKTTASSTSTARSIQLTVNAGSTSSTDTITATKV